MLLFRLRPGGAAGLVIVVVRKAEDHRLEKQRRPGAVCMIDTKEDRRNDYASWQFVPGNKAKIDVV